VFTKDERRALLFLLTVTALGGTVRAVRAGGGGASAPGAPFVPPPGIAAGDIERQAALSRRAEALARPLVPGEKVDVDRAEAAELERLPRVGPALARRIVDDRDSNGPFGSIGALARVSGIGPAMRRDLGRWATFSGVPRAAPGPADSAAARPARAAGTSKAAGACGPGPVEVNRADAVELACLPGVGPGLAARIVAERTAHGPFREVQDLERVPGLGRARVALMRDRILLP